MQDAVAMYSGIDRRTDLMRQMQPAWDKNLDFHATSRLQILSKRDDLTDDLLREGEILSVLDVPPGKMGRVFIIGPVRQLMTDVSRLVASRQFVRSLTTGCTRAIPFRIHLR
ncbi:hypothetical protein Taro_023794 [Colocasia esculenta]|uniref:Uncharacterized protein n=1 Tax=Colocasia esculenta TaxID=4460 RepID=A0A843VFK2_COLES|nr:hypothetical protein [Colocasia esculenta]